MKGKDGSKNTELHMESVQFTSPGKLTEKKGVFPIKVAILLELKLPPETTKIKSATEDSK